jgi:hypothetical protein
VNSFYWGNELRPSNGGGWVYAFTGRRMLFVQNETDVVGILDFIKLNGIKYIYLGEGAGVFNLDSFHDFLIQYQKDNVTILKVP